MRLDKFLQVSRLIRRRTVAQEFCQSGKIRQNGRVSKPGARVNPGDVLEIDFGWKVTRVRVLTVEHLGTEKMYEELTSS
ncbi:MAG TPA: RNA-binding S4 domain-containing protein [Firmicutes bacterium]|nr:RNA-binding S4 domain-containing protein [Candidatus Fermentithermobacillaceae bacterium]